MKLQMKNWWVQGSTLLERVIIGERSKPLSRVFNDQPHDIYIYIYGGVRITVRTYVSNAHAHVSMSVGVFCNRNSSAKKRKTF